MEASHPMSSAHKDRNSHIHGEEPEGVENYIATFKIHHKDNILNYHHINNLCILPDTDAFCYLKRTLLGFDF